MFKLEDNERNVKWILIISVILYFTSSLLTFIYLGYGSYYFYSHDAWYHLSHINALFFILTITSSTLCTANFKKEWTYKLSNTSIHSFHAFIVHTKPKMARLSIEHSKPKISFSSIELCIVTLQYP